jgi:hypothetical protein
VEKQRFNRILRGFFNPSPQKGTNHARFAAAPVSEPPAKRFAKRHRLRSESRSGAMLNPFSSVG